MAGRKRRRSATTARDPVEAAGFAELTLSNADEQFAKFLTLLDRIEEHLFELAADMRRNRQKIEVGLDRIGSNGDEIDRLLSAVRNG